MGALNVAFNETLSLWCDMEINKKYIQHFTLVFEGDIRQFKENPFKVDSPWGRPIASAMGNVMEENDELRDLLEQRADD